jgi:hypothetical protein
VHPTAVGTCSTNVSFSSIILNESLKNTALFAVFRCIGSKSLKILHILKMIKTCFYYYLSNMLDSLEIKIIKIIKCPTTSAPYYAGS